MRHLHGLALLALLVPAAAAQPAGDPPPAHPPADPADVASLDAIVAALYETISGPADAPRDWDRFLSLFHPDGRLVPTVPAEAGGMTPVASTPEAYAAQAAEAFRTAPLFQGKGFYETEAARRTERFGSIAHVWSTYESRLAPDEAPFMRGINSIQLVHDGARWWVLAVLWQHASEAVPVPAPYLPER